jgi:ornithine cyclodeaminase/alanine dehydrogenase-like protein (mu-crystallin family)
MTLLLDNDELAPLIDAREFVEAQDIAYRAFAGGEGVCTPRIDLQSATGANGANYQLGLAVGMAGDYAVLRIKSDMVFQRLVEGRPRKEKFCVRPGTYMGLLLVFDRASGELAGILHDGLVQKMRVGADSALGARYMSRPDSAVLAVLGSGGMARAHVDAMRAVRPITSVRVFSPTRANREAFAREVAERHGIEAVAVDDPDAACRGADLVASCASAIGPVIFGRQLEPGMHVTCIGGTLDPGANGKIDVALRFGLAPAPAELPDLAFADECLTFAEAGGKAAHGGTRRYADVPAERRVSFAGLLADPARGRTRPDQITFSERGNIHGLQFAAVCGRLLGKARAAGVGRTLDSALFLQSIRN